MAPTKRSSKKIQPPAITPIRKSPNGKPASDTHKAIAADKTPGRGYRVNGR